jgi:uncharacterized protein (DUF488 family)
MTDAASAISVLTVGHSTRPLNEFIGLLRAHSVARVADVRTIARSRHNPQFNGDTLPLALEQAGIGYTHLARLGGFRRPGAQSRNQGWRNASFRGYADYMQTAAFVQGLAELVELARRDRVAVMCAEAVPWRCHRSLIADALVVRGIAVDEIVSAARLDRLTLTPFARVEGTMVTYPATAKSGERS